MGTASAGVALIGVALTWAFAGASNGAKLVGSGSARVALMGVALIGVALTWALVGASNGAKLVGSGSAGVALMGVALIGAGGADSAAGFSAEVGSGSGSVPAGVTIGKEPVPGTNQLCFGGAPLTGASSPAVAYASGSWNCSAAGTVGAPEMGHAETGVAETGAAEIGVAETGTAEAGAADTGAVSTGSSGTCVGAPRPLIESSQPRPCPSGSASGSGDGGVVSASGAAGVAVRAQADSAQSGSGSGSVTVAGGAVTGSTPEPAVGPSGSVNAASTGA
ncbi:hypothetical protein [Paractinoplanes tereljensis]|uniref:hypothetical protein n=1 Tax=Paractinoplanes tereljensis TaxID=571912 RepID=UPI001942B7FE|nr:hypothetical protein [Actinoplanes tereljensis]